MSRVRLRQRGGRPKFLVDWEKRRWVTFVTTAWLGTASAITKQLCIFQVNVVRHHCEVCFKRGWIGCTSAAIRLCNNSQMQQCLNSVLSRKYVFTRLRFAQRYENWTIDDWKCVISNNETMINTFNLIGHDVRLENALHLNMFIRSWSMMVGWWWFGDAWRLSGREHCIKSKVGWISMFTSLIYTVSCGPVLHKITIWIQVGWSSKRIMTPSIQARLCENGLIHDFFNSFDGMHNL